MASILESASSNLIETINKNGINSQIFDSSYALSFGSFDDFSENRKYILTLFRFSVIIILQIYYIILDKVCQ